MIYLFTSLSQKKIVPNKFLNCFFKLGNKIFKSLVLPVDCVKFIGGNLFLFLFKLKIINKILLQNLNCNNYLI